jgi:hypothetical protein
MRQIEGKVYSHLSFDTDSLTDISDVATSAALEVSTFNELVEKIAILSFKNKDHLFFFRGQSKDHLNRNGNSSFYPSIYRTRAGENLTADILENRFNRLEVACRRLVEKFELAEIESLNEFKRRKYIQWSILQHYEVCDTPLIDVTQSIRVACSFAFLTNSSKDGYFFVFGLPYITNRISRNSEHDIVNIRLISICPPEALRPYYQEGYLVGTDDLTADYEDRSHLDLKRRLIAKFRIKDSRIFWGDEHSMIKSLLPVNDKIKTLCDEIRSELERQFSPASVFPGVWLNSYTIPGKGSAQERVEIRDGNKYYSDGRYTFDIDLVEIDKGGKKIRFRKVGVGTDNRKAINDLVVINDRHYEGFEHKANKVIYTRID